MSARYIMPLNPAVIGMCSRCGECFSWFPPNFDMMHRHNRETHKWCGGQIEEQEPAIAALGQSGDQK